MVFHTNVGCDNISSKFDFQGPGLKFKVTVAIFRKKHCHHSSAYIYQGILKYNFIQMLGIIISQARSPFWVLGLR